MINKFAVFALSLSLLVFGVAGMAFANQPNNCTPTNFCANKMDTLVTQMDRDCLSGYKEFNDQDKQNKEKGDLDECMDNYARIWRAGFGKSCGGPLAQDACMDKCKNYSGYVVQQCLHTCPGL